MSEENTGAEGNNEGETGNGADSNEGNEERKPFAMFHTKEAFDERLARATRAQLRELGIDPDQVKKDREELERMKKLEAERKQAEMTEVEKARAEAEERKKEAEEAAARAARAERDREIAVLAAKHRVPDVEYLRFRMDQRTETETEADEWLAGLLEDPKERVRFGVEGVSDTGDGEKGEQKKATTSATSKTDEKPPPKAKDGDEETNAMRMSPEKYARFKAKKYGGSSNSRRGYRPPGR